MSENFSLDTVDLQLLAQLQTDAAQPLSALAACCRVSVPTVQRRLRRLLDSGLIERRVALVQPQRLAQALGGGSPLLAIVEVGLEQQGEEHVRAFEALAVAETAVQQCYRTSAGPDFVLVVAARDMDDYLALAQRLLSAHANVRHVKSYFCLRRAKFSTQLPLPPTAAATC
jgi:DNA-binding Lrp family transcriptional regulator